MEGYAMTLDGKSKEILGVLAVCTVLTVFGCLYLDTRLARFIADEIGDGFLLSGTISNLPDLLLPLVGAMTFMSWAARLFIAGKPSRRPYAEFLEYLGSALPIAFLLKSALKDVFGRTNARLWLLHPHLITFHWFDGGGDFSGFPSGHMVVFTVLVLGISRYFPRLRLPCAVLLIVLALALLVTQYHFLSDIAAGVSVGALVDLLVCRGLSFFHRLADRRRCPGSM